MGNVAVDLFAGAGGWSCGFHAAGWHTAVAVEWEPGAKKQWAAKTYAKHHSDTRLLNQDIRTVTAADLGRADHWHLSPPCQDFSAAGKGAGWDGHRGDLMWEPVRLLTEARDLGILPRTISAENVEGLTFEKHRPALMEWLDALKALDYQLNLVRDPATGDWIPPVVDASWYGVPQFRHRMILLGGLDGVPPLPQCTHWPPAECAQATLFEQRLPWVTVRQALAGLPDPVAGRIAARRTRNGKVVEESRSIDEPSVALRAPGGGSSHLFLVPANHEPPPGLTRQDGTPYGYEQANRPMDPDAPSQTIPAHHNSGIPILPANHQGSAYRVKDNGYLGNRPLDADEPSPALALTGNVGGPVPHPHPNGARRLTVRECMRIQTFPDDYVLLGPMSATYRQTGNAVPVLLAKRVGEALLAHHMAEEATA